ncbi:MAG: CotH kinase family protein [Prevotella sp.]|nr:CotH kinase family protein [Prevotella sp.]
MRKLLACFVPLAIMALTAAAKPGFESGRSYRIVCLQFTAGCVTDGASAGKLTPLHYLAQADGSQASQWTITEADGSAFYIRNAATGQYVTYDGVRQGDTRRYVSMTSQADGKKSMWTFTQQQTGVFVIRNAQQTDHLWDVRVSSYVVGTYSNSGNGNLNQLFALYDEDGRQVKEVFESKAPLATAMTGLTIGDSQSQYTTDNGGLYLLTTQKDNFGSDATMTVTYQQRDGWGPLTIDGTPVESGSAYTFSTVTASKTWTLSVVNTDGVKVSAKMTMTALPVVSIYGSFGYDYTEGDISVQEPAKEPLLMQHMKAKWRGGITNGSDKHKRNYHVKLLDANGQKQDQKFFGLRNDNSWILESCQVDMSRIRNRIITDLWNDFSTPPYYAQQEPKAMTGTRGQFVELVLNEEYRGIYCMTEAMDRKQMKLAKYDETTRTMHGQLWKSKDWSYAVFMGHYLDNNSYPMTAPVSYNNSSESWDQYYVKYPDFDDVNPTDWQTLRNAVNFVCTASNTTFKAQVADYFDMPLLIDYYILMETIMSADNHGKNMYFAVYDKQTDKRITFGVWDMDATMGQRWSDAYYHSTIMQPEQDYTNYIVNNEHGDYNLFRRIKATNPDDFNMQIRLRYRDLRQTYLQTDAIIARFEQQLADFKACGAAAREYRKWSGDSDVAGKTLNFDTELSYLKNWITKRMQYLDKTRFRIADLPSAIYTATADADYAASDHAIYTLSGHRVSSDNKTETVRLLPHGIYVTEGRKLIK